VKRWLPPLVAIGGFAGLCAVAVAVNMWKDGQRYPVRVPAGAGWYCHANLGGEICRRDPAECSAQAVPMGVACRPVPVAHCFTFYPNPALAGPDYNCSVAAESCETRRTGVRSTHAELRGTSDCEETP
jgi:hypothetical protein